MADEAHAPTDPTPPPPAGGPRKLVRRPDDGHIAGVCAGVAEYFNVDPIIVRIAAVVLLFTGPGFFAYLAAWIFVPATDGSMLVDSVKPIPDDKTTQIVGIAIIVLAVSVMFGGWWTPARHWLWPLGLIGIGAWLLLRRKDDAAPAPPPGPPGPSSPPAPWAAPTPTFVAPAPPAPAGATEAPPADGDAEAPDHEHPATDTAATDTATADGTTDRDATDDPTGELPTSALGGVGGVGGGGDLPPTAGPTAAVPSPPPIDERSRRRGRFLGPLVFGALLLWSGIAWLGGVEVDDGLAIGLCIIGVGFVVGAFVGGSRALIFPALVVGSALLFTSVVDIPWQGGIGDRRWDVDRRSEIESPYRLGIGEGTLDLRDLRTPAGTTTEIEAHVGIGHLVVLVPRNVQLEIDADVGAGEARVLGRNEDGLGVGVDRTVSGSAARGALELDLRVGFGQLEVRYADE